MKTQYQETITITGNQKDDMIILRTKALCASYSISSSNLSKESIITDGQAVERRSTA